MDEAAPASFDLSALIRGALTAKEALGLQPEQTDQLFALFCSVGLNHSILGQRLARREEDLTRALTGNPIEATSVQALIDDLAKLRADFETTTLTGLEGLRAALTGDQFSQLLAFPGGSAKGSGASSEIKQAVDSYLDQRIKDKNVVEVEVAAKVADRVFGWVKLFGFFLAAPVSIVMIGLSVFGITQVSDIYSHVASYKAQLEDTLNSATKDANAIKLQLAELKKQNEGLQSAVTKLQKCVFGNPAATKAGLETALGGFRKYMVQVGFGSDAAALPIEIDPENMVSNAYSYYDAGPPERIVLSSCAAGEAGMLFHEYSHYVLLHSLSFNAYKALSVDPDKVTDMALFAIEGGLASYFACSYQNDPVLGRPQAQPDSGQSPVNSQPLINLENRGALSGAGTISSASNGRKLDEVKNGWGGLFWDIRKAIGAAQADRIMLAAWRALPAPEQETHPYSAEMAAQILAQVRLKAGEQKADAVRQLFKDRALEF
jgi:hypothetical protein